MPTSCKVPKYIDPVTAEPLSRLQVQEQMIKFLFQWRNCKQSLNGAVGKRGLPVCIFGELFKVSVQNTEQQQQNLF